MFTRCSMPPESWRARLPSWPSRPNSRSTVAGSKPTRPAIFCVKRTSSMARFHGSTDGRCETRPSSRLRRASAAVSLPMRTSPLDGDKRSATMRSNVVLPQPEGPTSAMNSPAAISRSVGLSAQVSPNWRETPRMEIGAATSYFLLLGEEVVGHHLGGRDGLGYLIAALQEADH